MMCFDLLEELGRIVLFSAPFNGKKASVSWRNELEQVFCTCRLEVNALTWITSFRMLVLVLARQSL
jgi:hypothetical protein